MPKKLRQSITFDNGTEFAEHHVLRSSLGIKTYFCEPYKPWQKGGVENAIGRLRRRLPRKTDLANVSSSQLQQLAALYNQHPKEVPRLADPSRGVLQNCCTSNVNPPPRLRGDDGIGALL